MQYPAFIEIDADGTSSGWFPDVDGCIFAGKDIDEAYADAANAFRAHFEALVDNELKIPAPKPMQAHIIANAAEYSGGQWAVINVNMDQFDGRAERINITLPPSFTASDRSSGDKHTGVRQPQRVYRRGYA
ncbi:putative RNase H-like HicB family nuclease [Erwinia sp. JUb26]|nr:putative RNase H-like HicB family nuclease [Erwinia sp. JUb26]